MQYANLRDSNVSEVWVNFRGQRSGRFSEAKNIPSVSLIIQFSLSCKFPFLTRKNGRVEKEVAQLENTSCQVNQAHQFFLK